MELKRWINYLLAGMLLCVFLSTPALAGKTLVVAINPNWPPMEMKDKKGKITGYEIDLIKAMGEAAGFRVKFVEVPWKTIFTGLEKGKYDAVMASVSITEARKDKYDFSEPYFTTEQLFVVPKAKREEPLREKSIAAFKLTTGAEAIRLYQKVNIAFYTVEETDKAFKDLSKGFIDGILCDSPMALDYATGNNNYKDKFALTTCILPDGVQIPKEYYGIAVRKGNAEILDLINRGLQAVKEKGIDSELRTKWIKSSELVTFSSLPSKDSLSLQEPTTTVQEPIAQQPTVQVPTLDEPMAH
jgi:polar amino acid transport system substrate-binding protein